MMGLCYSIVLLLLVALVNAQTETVINGAGATVVEVITQNAAGVPTTRILQTLVSSTSTPTRPGSLTSSLTTNPLLQTTALATTAPQVGPVGQPATEPPAGGPTPYIYTTTNAAGDPIEMTGIFTPTGPSTVLPPTTTTGTILNYSQWLSAIGTNTQPANAATRISTTIPCGWYYLVATTLVGLAGGAWLVV